VLGRWHGCCGGLHGRCGGVGSRLRSPQRQGKNRQQRRPSGGAESLAFGGTGGGHVTLQGMGVHVDIFGDEDLDDIAFSLRGGTGITWAFRPSHLERTWDDGAERLTGGLGKDVHEVPAIGR
jgi:hypothetical protein